MTDVIPSCIQVTFTFVRGGEEEGMGGDYKALLRLQLMSVVPLYINQEDPIMLLVAIVLIHI